MIKHICFDLDGTLAIQSPEFKIVRDELKYKTFAKVIGKDVDEDTKKQFDDLYKKYGSISSIFTKEFGKESDFWLQHFETLGKEKYYLPNEKITETIKKLKEKFSLSVFTNSKLKGAKKTLNYIKINEDNFDFILSGDDISERKPALDGYKKVIELTGLKPEEILYIGDRVEADIIPAKKVGMKTGLVWKKSKEADYSFINFEEIIEKLYEKMKHNLKDYLGKTVKVEMDRPMGSKHPKHGFMYPINYGFIPNTLAPDGAEIDAYILGEFEPLEKFEGKVIAIIDRKNDIEQKLVVSNKKYTKEQIFALVEFQERYFDVDVIV